jgi:hypothetical protein
VGTTVLYSQFPLVQILLHSNSTSRNFIPIAQKFVLVEFILVETVLVGDPLYRPMLITMRKDFFSAIFPLEKWQFVALFWYWCQNLSRPLPPLWRAFLWIFLHDRLESLIKLTYFLSYVSQSCVEAGFLWKIKIRQNCPSRLNLFASPGHRYQKMEKKTFRMAIAIGLYLVEAH